MRKLKKEWKSKGKKNELNTSKQMYACKCHIGLYRSFICLLKNRTLYVCIFHTEEQIWQWYKVYTDLGADPNINMITYLRYF